MTKQELSNDCGRGCKECDGSCQPWGSEASGNPMIHKLHDGSDEFEAYWRNLDELPGLFECVLVKLKNGEEVEAFRQSLSVGWAWMQFKPRKELAGNSVTAWKQHVLKDKND